ncbi:mitogen-activated protein kinase kinase kinase 7-like isoform X1 [Lytechinus variegatus]|uniref:mitogen-activated protein kinase kinase kinase 7-like isoform X1 n=1 Tax=Lytechinus variegatus TaxID=7654 RepID=UPI001BB26FCB|nr:mitogen-activated protein kinase kinase kinase 7-like isoform X1 [Lytechinus variegatus]
MARLESQMSFKEEVDFNDLEFERVVGKGAFGVVSKAKWRSMNVAVKMIESEEEIKAFRVEVRQLSRVDHPNIVKLYGACTTRPVCLVMEYAEGGSLYNVLHSSQPQPIYKAAHAMSWALQCAKGVDYLHCMTPKKLIHRDLKPANLLLMSGGTVLKICDFGTACDFHTYMTNNKGSAAWMAPEVFEGSAYSEKCDIFSWGVILWEVISRRKPFDDIGGPAFRIMWAVHNGRRPPLIRNIPKPLEKLMTRCWSSEAKMRPSMHEVVSIMSNLMVFFKGADQPLVYPQVSEEERNAGDGMADRLAEQTADMSLASNRSMDSRGSTISDTVIHSTSSHSNGPQDPQKIDPHAPFSDLPPVHPSSKDQKKRHSMDLLDLRVDEDNSAKSSVQTHRRSNSHGRILDQDIPKYFSPLPTKPPVSAPPPPVTPKPLFKSPPPPVTLSPALSPTPTPPQTTIPTPPHSTTPTPPHTTTPMHPQQTYPNVPPMPPPHHSISVPSDLSELDHPRQRPKSYHSSPYNAPTSLAQPHRHSSIELRQDITPLPQYPSHPPTTVLESRMGTRESTGSSIGGTTGQGRFDRSQSLEQRVSSSRMKSDDSDVSMAYSTLEPHLQPLPPNPNSRESQEIFDEHMRMAQEFLRVQTELALLHTRKKELADALDQDWKDKQASFKLIEEYNTLQGEKESLIELHKRRRSQLDMFRLQMQRQQHVGRRM